MVAATTWVGIGSGLGRLMTAVVSGAFGSLAWTVPLLLALLAWRFLRHPDRNAETGRITIGGAALVIGTLGLVHIAHGTPSPSNGADAIRGAGGLIGYVVSAPLVAGLTPWVAAPLLALLCGFGLLVITGTPLHRVPNRLAELRGTAADDTDGEQPDEQGRPGRKRPRHRGGRPQQAVRLAAAARWGAASRGRKGAMLPGEAPRPGGAAPAELAGAAAEGRGRWPARRAWVRRPGGGARGERRRPRRLAVRGASSSRSPRRATPATPCRPLRCCSRGPPPRHARMPTTWWCTP